MCNDFTKNEGGQVIGCCVTTGSITTVLVSNQEAVKNSRRTPHYLSSLFT